MLILISKRLDIVDNSLRNTTQQLTDTTQDNTSHTNQQNISHTNQNNINKLVTFNNNDILIDNKAETIGTTSINIIHTFFITYAAKVTRNLTPKIFL